ncbi:hypothetical protein D3C81_2146960 [compost metagenome]
MPVPMQPLHPCKCDIVTVSAYFFTWQIGEGQQIGSRSRGEYQIFGTVGFVENPVSVKMSDGVDGTLFDDIDTA